MDYGAFYITLKLAVVTTLILITLAAPIAYVLAFFSFRGKSFIESVIYLPTALPPTVLGFYLIMIMGPKGIAGRAWEAITGYPLLFSFAGITAACIIYSIPFAVQPMKAAFQKLDRRILENAYVLGLSKKAAFFRVILPNSVSGIAASAVLVFINSIGAFGIVMMVGGSIPGETKVASIAVYEAVESMDYERAGIISLGFLPVSYIFLLLANKLNKDSK